MRRRDLQCPRAEFYIYMLVHNNRNLCMRKRSEHLAPKIFREARIIRIYRHRHIA